MSNEYVGLSVFSFVGLIIGLVTYFVYNESIKTNHWLLTMGKLDHGTVVLKNCKIIYKEGIILGKQSPKYHIVLEGKGNAPTINFKASAISPAAPPYYNIRKLYSVLNDYPKNKPIPISWKKNTLYKGQDVIASIDGKTGFGQINLLAFVLFLCFLSAFLLIWSFIIRSFFIT